MTAEVTWPTISARKLREHRGDVQSVCGKYTITWYDIAAGRYYNAWYGDSPRQRVSEGRDLSLVKTACNQHARKHEVSR